MKVERIKAIPLDKKSGLKYAEIFAKENYNKDINRIKYLGGGSFGKVYGVDFADGKNIIIKFLRANDMLKKEIGDLQTVAKHCSVAMPQLLFSRPANGVIPVDSYAMSRINGKSAFACFDILLQNKRKRLNFAQKVTEALHEIHLCKSDKFGDALEPKYQEWLDFYKPFAKDILDKAEGLYDAGKLPKKAIESMRMAWEKFDVIFSEKVSEACLIHGDLNLANVMVDKSRNLSGFIDPLNSMYADREFDLFQFDNLFGKRFYLRQTYMREYGASKYCDAKCAFYGLYHEVYCYIKTDMYLSFFMNPLIKNMKKRLREL